MFMGIGVVSLKGSKTFFTYRMIEGGSKPKDNHRMYLIL